jgi:hypothetical protein
MVSFMYHRLFTGILGIWPRLSSQSLSVILLLLLVPAYGDQWKWNDGVIVQKVGPEFMFVFPSPKGRITAIATPSGKIQIGNTITIKYSLKITQLNRARFISLDASKLPIKSQDIAPNLTIDNKNDVIFGFLVKDTGQGQLDIFIDPKFAENISQLAQNRLKLIQQKIGHEGNLNVIMGPGDKNNFKIIKIEVN